MSIAIAASSWHSRPDQLGACALLGRLRSPAASTGGEKNRDMTRDWMRGSAATLVDRHAPRFQVTRMPLTSGEVFADEVGQPLRRICGAKPLSNRASHESNRPHQATGGRPRPSRSASTSRLSRWNRVVPNVTPPRRRGRAGRSPRPGSGSANPLSSACPTVRGRGPSECAKTTTGAASTPSMR